MTLYADLDAFKAYLRIGPTDDVDDAELTRALGSASRVIDHLCSRTFGVAETPAVARFYTSTYDVDLRRYVVHVDDVQTTDGMVITLWNPATSTWDTAVDLAEVGLYPLNAPANALPWNELALPSGVTAPTQVSDDVMVVAMWGWTTTPDQVVTATLIQASRFYARRDARFGIVGSPDGGESMRLFNTVDPDVVVSLRGLIKYWGAR